MLPGHFVSYKNIDWYQIEKENVNIKRKKKYIQNCLNNSDFNEMFITGQKVYCISALNFLKCINTAFFLIIKLIFF